MFDKETFLAQAVEISPEEWATISSCLVLAPHPDDESLGCGGLIALLRNEGKEVNVVLTTDGSQSHPNSKAFPPDKVAEIRKGEVIKALKLLDVAEDKVMFFNGKDAALPTKEDAGFNLLLNKLVQTIKDLNPQLILVPYELDPHCDHRATWQLLNEALKEVKSISVWEYPIWLYELATKDDIPSLGPGALKKINIIRFLELKEQAIRSHQSQTTRMIDDDPTGFMLTDKVIAHFTTKFEYYIER